MGVKNMIKIDKNLDKLPKEPIFKEKYESAKIFIKNLKKSNTFKDLKI